MSSKSAWTPVYWDDWIGDTQDLSLLEHGAYFRLMAAYYATGGELSADRRRLYRLCGALESDEQEAIDLICGRFFRTENGWLRHDRADRELNAAAEKRAKAQAAAAKRHAGTNADARADAHADADAGAHADAPATRAHDPQPTTHNPQDTTHSDTPQGTGAPSGAQGSRSRSGPKKIPPPEGVSQQVWDDFTSHRTRMKAPLTVTAANRIANELDRAEADGWTKDDALGEAMAAGWRGVKAEWLANRKASASPGRPGQGAQPETPEERGQRMARQRAERMGTDGSSTT